MFQLRGLDLSSSPEISALIRNFDQEKVTASPRVPGWDLSLVLLSLMKSPYEPLDKVSLRFLSLKTVFLIALASAKRVSEIHAISHVVSHKRDWSSVSLSLLPEFVAKTQVPGRASSGVLPFSIPALTTILGESDPDALLCPVRALRVFLRKTQHLRPGCRRLFVTTNTQTPKGVSKNTISFWIRQVIRSAYEGTSEEDRALVKVKAHEVRALATSLLFRKNCSIEDVMSAASWRSHSTFASFYLRDAAHQYLDLHSLGPVVAAHQVV